MSNGSLMHDKPASHASDLSGASSHERSRSRVSLTPSETSLSIRATKVKILTFFLPLIVKSDSHVRAIWVTLNGPIITSSLMWCGFILAWLAVSNDAAEKRACKELVDWSAVLLLEAAPYLLEVWHSKHYLIWLRIYLVVNPTLIIAYTGAVAFVLSQHWYSLSGPLIFGVGTRLLLLWPTKRVYDGVRFERLKFQSVASARPVITLSSSLTSAELCMMWGFSSMCFVLCVLLAASVLLVGILKCSQSLALDCILFASFVSGISMAALTSLFCVMMCVRTWLKGKAPGKLQRFGAWYVLVAAVLNSAYALDIRHFTGREITDIEALNLATNWSKNSLWTTLFLHVVLVWRCKLLSFTGSTIPTIMRYVLFIEVAALVPVHLYLQNFRMQTESGALELTIMLPIFLASMTINAIGLWVTHRTVILVTPLLTVPAGNVQQFRIKMAAQRARCERLAVLCSLLSSVLAVGSLTFFIMNFNITEVENKALCCVASFGTAFNSIVNDVAVALMCGLGRKSAKSGDADVQVLCKVMAEKQHILEAAERAHNEAKAVQGTNPWKDGFEFWFLDADKLRASTGFLQKHQVLRSMSEWLSKRRINLQTIVNYEMCHDTVAVSYVWQSPGHPDPDCRQTDALRLFLNENPQIKFVWLDWCSLPQKERTETQTVEFAKGLKYVNMIYLAATVVIVWSEQYLSKFWPQFEAFIGFQCVGHNGLEPADAEQRRVRVAFSIDISADEQESNAIEIEKKWASVTIDEAKNRLADPRVQVTNGKDKLLQIGKLIELQQDLKDVFTRWRTRNFEMQSGTRVSL